MTLHAPQIIYLILCLYVLMSNAYHHGKVIKKEVNVFVESFGMTIGLLLLYWGGFFG